jgi:PAS domain S-box-containing protein
MDTQRKDIGKNLRALRRRLGLTQAVFGERYGYSARQIQTYERGEAAIPVDLLLALRAQGYPLETLLGEQPPQSGQPGLPSTDLYQLVAHWFPGLVALFDAELRFVELTGEEALAPTGWARTDLVGKTIFEVLTEDELAAFAERYRAVFRGEPWSGEVAWHGRYWQVRLLPARVDPQGQVQLGMQLALDITESKQQEAALRQQEQIYRAVTELATDLTWVWQVDAKGQFQLIKESPGFLHLMGWAEEESQPAAVPPCGQVVSDDLPYVRTLMARTLANEEVAGEVGFYTSTGAVKRLSLVARPLWDPQQQRVTLVVVAGYALPEPPEEQTVHTALEHLGLGEVHGQTLQQLVKALTVVAEEQRRALARARHTLQQARHRRGAVAPPRPPGLLPTPKKG